LVGSINQVFENITYAPTAKPQPTNSSLSDPVSKSKDAALLCKAHWWVYAEWMCTLTYRTSLWYKTGEGRTARG